MSDSAPSQLEYYVRQPSDSDARGPFTLAQLDALAKAGGFNENTLYFDANADQWLSVCESPELAALLPAQKKISPPSSDPGVKFVCVLLFAGSAALEFPALLASSGGAGLLLRHPTLWIAALDIALAVCCGIFGVKFFRVIRIRAGLGIGFLGVLFWMQSNTGALIAAVIASICLWLVTSLATKRARVFATIAGLAASLALGYTLVS